MRYHQKFSYKQLHALHFVMQCNLFLEKTPLVETSFPFEDKEHIAKVGYVKSSALLFLFSHLQCIKIRRI